MNIVEIIKKKRDGYPLYKEEIKFLIKGLLKKEIPEYQFSSLLMTIFFNGMSDEETSFLTEEMLYSGKVMDLSSIPYPKIDKHSTGGVGDKTSLIIAPIAAALNVCVPMISGRGLGHTGGTLDKLESIPGFRIDLSLSEFRKVLTKHNASLIGQTKDIAPADKRIYALRDVTATVDSIPLITASIMSKKLAEGIDGLVLDVKTGSGAFMTGYKDSLLLADSLINTAKMFDKKVIAFITDMNQPLGNNIGNWLEVVEVISILKCKKKNDLSLLSINLAGAMLFLAGKTNSIKKGTELADKVLKTGQAYRKFLDIVKAQGGDISFIQKPEKYPKSKYKKSVSAEAAGYLTKVNTYSIGMAALELGAGRQKVDDEIDHKAGVIFNYKIGDHISKGDPIAVLFADTKKRIKAGEEILRSAVTITNEKIKAPPLIRKIIY